MPSRGRRHALADHRREFHVAVDLAQPDLPRRHETEEQADGGVLSRQRPRSLDPPTKLFVQAFNGVRIWYERVGAHAPIIAATR